MGMKLKTAANVRQAGNNTRKEDEREIEINILKNRISKLQ
jgi:hypothetical protein